MITKFKLFESLNDITIPDVAWLYFLHYRYNGKIEIKSWEKDNRMNNTNCKTSLEKFNCVTIDDKYFISSEECVSIIDKYFGAKTFEKAVQMKYDLLEYDKNYKISEIPYELFIEKKPTLYKAFDKISDKIVDHFNSQSSNRSILEKLSKMRYILHMLQELKYQIFHYL